MKTEKPKKERSEKYDPKLSTKTTFEETVKIALNYNQKAKESDK